MNIYFAGSMRGGRDDIDLYQEIINLLKSYGTVLTEHVSDKNLEFTEKDWDQKRIYTHDMEMLRRSDIMVAEVSTPSLGVGYEIAKFEGKPTLCLVNKTVGSNLSSMIAGNPNVDIKEYQDIGQISQIIKEFIGKSQ